MSFQMRVNVLKSWVSAPDAGSNESSKIIHFKLDFHWQM